MKSAGEQEISTYDEAIRCYGCSCGVSETWQPRWLPGFINVRSSPYSSGSGPGARTNKDWPVLRELQFLTDLDLVGIFQLIAVGLEDFRVEISLSIETFCDLG